MQPVHPSVTIITLNEEANLADAIRSVTTWADDVLVVDSGSTDRTVEIARQLGARVLVNAWPVTASKRTSPRKTPSTTGCSTSTPTSACRAELARELAKRGSRPPRPRACAASASPGALTISAAGSATGAGIPTSCPARATAGTLRWTEPCVHEELDGRWRRSRSLEALLDHYAFPSIREQVLTNVRYATPGSRAADAKPAALPSRARLVFKPIGKFLETFVVKRGFLDGLPGFIISDQRRSQHVHEARVPARGAASRKRDDEDSDRRQHDRAGFLGLPRASALRCA